jgi:hypothetical protein
MVNYVEPPANIGWLAFVSFIENSFLLKRFNRSENLAYLWQCLKNRQFKFFVSIKHLLQP